MKSFFKGLSLVLAALMVVTAVPAAQAKAADALNAKIDGEAVKADAQYSFTDNASWAVGKQHKIVIEGTGLSKEDAAAQTITSSDETVIKVVDQTKGTIEVAGYGSALLTVKAGSFTDTLTIGIYTKRNFDGKQTAYNAATFTFATADEAEDAAKNMKIKRVVTTPDGAVYEIKATNAKAKQDADNKKLVVVTGLTDKATYKFSVGTQEPKKITTSIGLPKTVEFGELDIKVSQASNLEGEVMNSDYGVFSYVVRDDEGKILKANTHYKIDFEPENDNNASYSMTDDGPQITFTAADDGTVPSIDIVATVSYRAKATDEDDTTFTARQSYEASKYVTPSFKGNFVSAVGLAKTDANTKEKVALYYTSNFNEYIKLNAGDQRDIVFYFVAEDGKDTKYTDRNNTKALLDAKALSGEVYQFWFKLENNNSVLSSVSGNTIKAFSEGRETILIYQDENPNDVPNTTAAREDASILVGIINVEVAAAPYVSTYNLNTKSLKGYTGSIVTTGEITFQLKDQNRNVFGNTTVVVTTEAGVAVPPSAISVSTVDKDGKGTITVDYTDDYFDKEQTYRFRVKSTDALSGSQGELITVTKAKISGTQKYKIMVDNVKVNNAAVTDSENKLAAVISVKNLKGDAEVANESFGVLDCMPNDYSKYTTDSIEGAVVGGLYIVVCGPDGKPINTGLHIDYATNTAYFATVSTENAAAAGVAGSTVYTKKLAVDLYDDTITASKSLVTENIKFGTYSVYLFQCSATTSGTGAVKYISFTKKTSTPVTFTVTENLETIYVDPVNQLTFNAKTGAYEVAKDGNGDALKNAVETISKGAGNAEADQIAYAKKALGEMYYALDLNSDGKFNGAGETGMIKNLVANGGDIVLYPNNRSYIVGADGKSIYFKTVEIWVSIPHDDKSGNGSKNYQTVKYIVPINKAVITK